ncbi:MAG: hypothetical protein JRH20_01435 [Deltaproteobacteria bacterium]|nr:hypothetical protein [Deltaproteobacteria bacterium]
MNLLLVVGAALFLLAVGTLLGRYYAPDRRPLKRAAREGRSYVRGLVELLEGHEDAAIEQIKKALKQNTKTVEAYFALGALFRNRCEYERAVRVHQSILVRRDVDKGTKLRVHYQLALDFRAAGFPRRAVKALEYVLGHDKKHVQALTDLAKLYERVGAWERAAASRIRLGKLQKRDSSSHVAHLMAQHAYESAEAGDKKAAQRALRRAISANAESVHVLHVLGELRRREGKLAGAVNAWRKALLAAPDLASFFLARLERVLFEMEKLDDLQGILDEASAAHPSNVYLRLAVARFRGKRDPQGALVDLRDLTDEYPHLLPARREAALLVLEQDEPSALRAALEELLGALSSADHGYRCAQCGHATLDLFWRCSSCGAWDATRMAWGRRASERVAS